MNKRILIVILLVGVLLIGCSSNRGGLTGKQPPEVVVEYNDKRVETVLGTYCWGSMCVDKVGPKELLKDKKPIQVKAGEKLTIVMDYEPKPNEFYLSVISGEKESEVTLHGQQFTAPAEKGLYYYTYGVWWMDEKEKNVSNGDAFYAFALEVK